MTPERLRGIVSTVLLSGVTLSAALIAIGFVGSFAVGWPGSLVGAPNAEGAVTDFGGIVEGLMRLRPQAIGQLGLLVLVATPILRVVTSLVGFALEGDRVYVAVSGVVLTVLLVSALLIR